MAKVLRPFHDAPSRRVVHPGDEVFPTPGRLEELVANGLVEASPAETKAEPAPGNKMAPVALNKASAPAPVRTPSAPFGGKARRR